MPKKELQCQPKILRNLTVMRKRVTRDYQAREALGMAPYETSLKQTLSYP